MFTLHEITYGSAALRILLAIVIGGVLGIERGRKNRPAGLRTYMLVCLGSTVVMMTNQYVSQLFGTGDPVRMGAQVISGIGFLGAGSIIVTGRNQIRGLTTAAGLWAAACIGLAIGIGFYEVAIAGGVAIFLILTVLQNLDFFTRKNSSVLDMYIELDAKESMANFVHFMRDAGLAMSNMQFESEYVGASVGITFVVTIKSIQQRPRDSILDTLRHIPGLVFMEEL